MKNFFEFDRRKKEDIVEQIVQQFISYVKDYKLLVGMTLPDINLVKSDLELTDKELKSILMQLQKLGYLSYDSNQKQYIVQTPDAYQYDFIVNVLPAYREIINAGKKPKIFTQAKQISEVDVALQAKFPGLVVGDKVVHYRRYITADNLPMFFIEFCLSLSHLPNADQVFQDDEPHLDLIMKKFSHQYSFHVREVNVVEAPDFVIELTKTKEKHPICTYGKYRFMNSKGNVVESGFAYMTDLTEFTTTTTDLTDLLI